MADYWSGLCLGDLAADGIAGKAVDDTGHLPMRIEGEFGFQAVLGDCIHGL